MWCCKMAGSETVVSQCILMYIYIDFLWVGKLIWKLHLFIVLPKYSWGSGENVAHPVSSPLSWPTTAARSASTRVFQIGQILFHVMFLSFCSLLFKALQREAAGPWSHMAAVVSSLAPSHRWWIPPTSKPPVAYPLAQCFLNTLLQ